MVRLSAKTADGEIVGSGFVLSNDGVVVTNYHVIEGTKLMRSEFSNHQTAQVLGYKTYDPDHDLAIIKVESGGLALRPLTLANEPPRKGLAVATFGAPLGLDFVTADGIVSAVRSGHDLDMFGGHFKGTLVQTTAPISHGNSGGPLVDMRGTVVGVNTASLAEGQNLNFAVSSIHVQELLKRCTDKIYTAMPTNRAEEAWPLASEVQRWQRDGMREHQNHEHHDKCQPHDRDDARIQPKGSQGVQSLFQKARVAAVARSPRRLA